MSLSGHRLVGPGRSASGAPQFFKQLAQRDRRQQEELRRYGLRGAFVVSDDTFYMEYNLSSSDGSPVILNGTISNWKKPLNYLYTLQEDLSNSPFRGTLSTSENGMVISSYRLIEEIIGLISRQLYHLLLRFSKILLLLGPPCM